jgi:Fe2+ transport system protein B
MVTVIKKGRPIREMIQKLNELVSKKNRGLQSTKYSGKIKSQIDPLDYQKDLRNEWK